MDKRLILAIALSLLVLLSWSAWTAKFYPIDKKEVIEKTLPITPPPSPIISVLKEPEPPVSSLIKHSTKNFEVTFIEPQASIKEIVFKNYQSYKFPLDHGFLISSLPFTFKKESSSSDSVTFVYNDNNKKIIKRFIFSESNYNIELYIEMSNLSNLELSLALPLVLGVLDFAGNKPEQRFQDVTLATKDRVHHLNARKDLSFSEIKFLGLRDRYFCAIIEPSSGDYAGFIKKINPQESEIGLATKEILLRPGQSWRQKFHIYLGPQDLKLITQLKSEWQAIMHFGTFDFISHFLLQLLGILYNLLHNWGVAIILLSIGIYFLLYPLSLKQMRSMKQMQALQPHIAELRKTHKDNPQKLNKEIMELYRQHKVNPFGGCLPLVLQIPIFFALYQALMRSIALKGAKFLWIKDLSEPDRLFILPVSLPILGNELNILPILMTIGMFVQQRFSMAQTSSGSAEQQRLMLILFPLMFGFIFYHMPSGLVLYWFINSMLMLIYQFRITRTK